MDRSPNGKTDRPCLLRDSQPLYRASPVMRASLLGKLLRRTIEKVTAPVLKGGAVTIMQQLPCAEPVTGETILRRRSEA
jgi:hypothetical protein